MGINLAILTAFPQQISWGYLYLPELHEMPIYEYECTSCCNVFEVVQRMTEAPLTTCPECSGSVKKLMSSSSFQLKGGGWYADGYSTKSCNGSGSAATDAPIKNSSEKAEKSTDSSASAGSSASTAKSKESSSATT